MEELEKLVMDDTIGNDIEVVTNDVYEIQAGLAEVDRNRGLFLNCDIKTVGFHNYSKNYFLVSDLTFVILQSDEVTVITQIFTDNITQFARHVNAYFYTHQKKIVPKVVC